MQRTNRETVRLLCKSILNRLENQKVISFVPENRQKIREEVYGLLGPIILTEQDLSEKAVAAVGASADALESVTSNETDQLRAARQVLKDRFKENELHGFFFQRPLRDIAKMVSTYLMGSDSIEEVYETDESIHRAVLEVIQRFDPEKMA